MSAEEIDLAAWDRAEQFRLFRGYGRPHYAVTARVDVSRAVARRRADGLSLFRAAIHAIGAGVHAVPALRTRFRGETVLRHPAVILSPTIPTEDGAFRFAHLRWDPGFAAFDAEAAPALEAARSGAFNPDTAGRDDIAFLSCLPWLDFTALDHAVPGPEDCIPRISWGKVVSSGGGHGMALGAQVHHALVDGRDLGRFVEAVQAALDAH